jgi:hypothetical protein
MNVAAGPTGLSVGPLVAQTDQLVHGDRAEHLGLVAQHVGDARRAHHDVAPAVGAAHAHVVDVGSDGRAHVRHERPRGRRPHEQVEVAVDDGETHVHRRLGDVAVRARLPELVAGERGAAPAAVRDDLVALVDVAVVPHLAEQPPDRLDERVVERPVGIVGVQPHPDAAGECLEVGDVAMDRLPAQPVELGDSVRLDLVLVVQPQLLLDLHLDRQAVAVPTAFSRHVPAPHRLVAGVEVLEQAGPHVVDPGPAVGSRRSLVEHPLRSAGPAPQALGEDGVGVPAVEGGVFERDEVERRRDGVEGHPGIVRATVRDPSADWAGCPPGLGARGRHP